MLKSPCLACAPPWGDGKGWILDMVEDWEWVECLECNAPKRLEEPSAPVEEAVSGLSVGLLRPLRGVAEVTRVERRKT